MSKRITVTLPDEFAPLYEHLVEANPRSSSSEVMQEALIALARSKPNGKGKGKHKSKGKHKAKHDGNGKQNGYGKLPEVQLASQDMTRARRARQRRDERAEHEAQPCHREYLAVSSSAITEATGSTA